MQTGPKFSGSPNLSIALQPVQWTSLNATASKHMPAASLRLTLVGLTTNKIEKCLGEQWAQSLRWNRK